MLRSTTCSDWLVSLLACSSGKLKIIANKLVNQYLHVVDLNIDRYYMIIGCDLIRSLGIDIHGGDMTIHWDNTAIPWRDIDSTEKYVFALSRHNAPFNAETKEWNVSSMLNILKQIFKPSQKDPLILTLKKEMIYTPY